MEKLMYAVWRRDDESNDALNGRLLGLVREQLLELGAERLKINVIDERVAHAALYTPALRPSPVTREFRTIST